jgi:hypothetical protein
MKLPNRKEDSERIQGPFSLGFPGLGALKREEIF